MSTLKSVTAFVITSMSSGPTPDTSVGPRALTNLVLDDLNGSSIGVTKWHEGPDAKTAAAVRTAWETAVAPLVGKAVIDADLSYRGSFYTNSAGVEVSGNSITLIGFDTTGETVERIPSRSSSRAF